MLTVVDEFTRECLTVEAEYRMNAEFVAETLQRLFKEKGAAPKYVRSDNGPEFIARHLMRALGASGVEARHSPMPWRRTERNSPLSAKGDYRV
jgi:putative transposase